MNTRITKAQADEVAKRLAEPVAERLQKAKKEIAKIVTEIVLDNMPPPMRKVYFLYNKALRPLNYYYATVPSKFGKGTRSVTVSLDRCPDPGCYDCKDMQELLDAAPIAVKNDLRRYSAEAADAEDDLKTIKKQVACTVQNIGTRTRLKEEFPEAAAALKQVLNEWYGQNRDSKPALCDAVEEIRAKIQTSK